MPGHSVRFRLTLLYGFLIGGLLIFSSLLIFWLLGVIWRGQVDQILRQTAETIIQESGPTGFNLAGLQTIALRPDVVVLKVKPTGQVAFSWPNGFNEPLYASHDLLADTHYADVSLLHRPPMRVLSIPLPRESRPGYVLQVAMPIDVPVSIQTYLLISFGAQAVFLVLLSVILGLRLSQWVLNPLEKLADMTGRIASAEDLSIRIPEGNTDDEIGQVIAGFNATLERLETLFVSQQRFLADVSHELRTPLTVIKGNVGLMRRAQAYDQEMLDSIEEEVNRLTRMVESLLLLAKAESGKLTLQKRPLELDALILDVLGSMQVLAEGKVTLELESLDQIEIEADADRLKQVFVNLISNAIKYTPRGGKVCVGLQKDGQRVKCWVRDTGPGIPAEDLPYIFERFYRAEKSRTRRAKDSGFGLGLSIAYWIVKTHGGEIQAASRPGEGTTFTVWLPLSGDTARDFAELPSAVG